MGAGVRDVVEFSKDQPEGTELVRQQSWPVDGPAELELTVDVGHIRVHLDESPGGGEVHVEVRHDPTVGTSWSQGLSGIISWLGNAAGAPVGRDPGELAAEAVRAAEITWTERGRRLVVRSAQELPLRVVPLAVTVSAPAGSRLAARAGAGDVRVHGRAGWAAVHTGSGDVTVDAVDGDADVTTGSGAMELGPITGRARVRTGSGEVSLARAGGPTEIKAGSGDVAVGEVTGDLGVRTGSGDVAIADARSGRLELTTGSGGLRIGVHPGVGAELDLSSGSGQTRSDLEVHTAAPAQPSVLHLRGRTGSGDVLVTRAMVPV